MPSYGIVTRIPQTDSEVVWRTVAYDQPDDPEGCFMYEFSQREGWQQEIRTKRDLEFFQSRSDEYQVVPASGRPEVRRPKKTDYDVFKEKEMQQEAVSKRGRLRKVLPVTEDG